MGFVQATANCFRNYFTFTGRAGRKEYFYFQLFLILLGGLAHVLDSLWFEMSTIPTPLTTGADLATLAPSAAVASRRLHDVGRSVYVFLWPSAMVVPLTLGLMLGSAVLSFGACLFGIGAMLWVALLFFLPGQPDANRYGPNPYAPKEPAADS